MKQNGLSVLAIAAFAVPVFGANPIFTDRWTADPAPFVEGDTIYVYTGHDNAPDNKPEYDGHRTVRMRKYDLVKDEVVPGTERIIINKGIRPEEKPIWCEGPHLYKIDGRDWCPTGRSTFLLPVKWIGSGDTRQPVILDKGKRVPMVLSAPKVATEARRRTSDAQRTVLEYQFGLIA